jgi:hypothetical protein
LTPPAFRRTIAAIMSAGFDSAFRRVKEPKNPEDEHMDGPATLLCGYGDLTEEFRRELRTLHGMCQDFVELRRGDHSGARLKMEQERLEREREKTEEEIVAHFQRWLKNPEVRDLVCQNYISPEERRARIREIFGREPKPVKTQEEMAGETAAKIREIYGLPPKPPESPEAAASADAGSNPVKPGQTRSNQVKLNETKSDPIHPVFQKAVCRASAAPVTDL